MKRSFGARPLADFTLSCLAPCFSGQGFCMPDLVLHWTEIVGEEIGAYCEPVKLVWPREGSPDPATLTLRVDPRYALDIQHEQGVILERITQFSGWRAVGRLVLRQAPLRRIKDRPVQALVPTQAQCDKVALRLGEFQNPELAQALCHLGAALGVK